VLGVVTDSPAHSPQLHTWITSILAQLLAAAELLCGNVDCRDGDAKVCDEYDRLSSRNCRAVVCVAVPPKAQKRASDRQFGCIVLATKIEVVVEVKKERFRIIRHREKTMAPIWRRSAVGCIHLGLVLSLSSFLLAASTGTCSRTDVQSLLHEVPVSPTSRIYVTGPYPWGSSLVEDSTQPPVVLKVGLPSGEDKNGSFCVYWIDDIVDPKLPANMPWPTS
jgi:hypothetical protein